MFRTLDSLTLITSHTLLTAIVGTVLLSFAEHAIHRNLMHRQQMWDWLYRRVPELRVLFRNHAVLHHGTYYERFDHEPNPEGKYFNLRILPADFLHLVVIFLPVLIGLALLVSMAAAATVLALIAAHTLVWNAAHVQMHVPETGAWFRNTGYFRFIARHHFMHHQRSGRNYNVVLPLADFVLGTSAPPRLGDVREMLRLGLLTPRTAVGRRMARVPISC